MPNRIWLRSTCSLVAGPFRSWLSFLGGDGDEEEWWWWWWWSLSLITERRLESEDVLATEAASAVSRWVCVWLAVLIVVAISWA